MPSSTTPAQIAAIRQELGEQARGFSATGLLAGLDLSISLPSGDPAEAILSQAALFEPDLLVLGAVGDFRPSPPGPAGRSDG